MQRNEFGQAGRQPRAATFHVPRAPQHDRNSFTLVTRRGYVREVKGVPAELVGKGATD